MSSACAVLCEGVTKVFPRREPSPGGSSSDMWLHYLRGWLRPGSSDPLAPSRTRLVAVDGVDLRIEPGEFFGLLGPNGAGKTTLVKMLATILVPSAGTAWVNGFDVTTQTRRVRSSVAVVSTSGWLGFDMQLPIEWNLKYWAALYGVPTALLDRRVREVLEIVDLAGKGRESSAVLSSGMRQRLAVAKGLLADAPVFLLDEPTIALDPKSANDIRLFIREEINDRKGTTVILTTQNMREAEEVCDRIAVLDRGRLVATGTVAGLRQRMPGRVGRLVGSGLSVQVIRAFRERFGLRHTRYNQSEPQGATWLRFHVANGDPPFSEMRSFLGGSGVRVLDLATIEPSLEDIYLSLTANEGIHDGTHV